MSHALALVFALYGCTTRTPDRSLLGLDPAEVSNHSDTTIVVRGTGFLETPSIALGSREKAELRGSYRVRVSDVFETQQVELLNAEQLQFVLPAGVEPGRYDLSVTPPLGATLTLPDALTVSGATGGTPPAPALDLETRADGQGELITERTLTVGESLELFAVFRDDSGAVVSPDQPVHFSIDPVLGVLSESAGLMTSFSARLPGDAILLALSDTGAQAEVALHIEPDAQHDPADYRLSIEDAAGGAGSALGASATYRAGAQLSCHAVVRDQSGAFVLDVPVTWSVAGAQAEPSQTSTSLSFILRKAGPLTISASDDSLGSASVEVSVSAGPAQQLSLAPGSASLSAGDPPLRWSVSAQDAYGNATDALGELTFAVSDGTFGDFDAASATLTPRRAGMGHITVHSSYGASATSGTIAVTAGPLSQLRLSPQTLQLSADAAPVAFAVAGTDAFDNATEALGTLTWSVLSGPIGTLSPAGVLDPTTAGSGTIQVQSSLGASAQSQTIEIVAGRAQSLRLEPQTWLGVVSGATQQFMVTGLDADGNPTSDLGSLSFSSTGPIATLDADSGLFTPTAQGQGTISAHSSYGLQATSQTIVVSSPNATLTISDLRVPGTLFPGATAPIEIDVTNSDAADGVVTGLGLRFSDGSQRDISGEYGVVADNANSDRVPPGATQTLVYYVSVAAAANSLGSASVSAQGEGFLLYRAPVSLSRSTATNVLYPLFGTGLSVDAPVPPNDRRCSGGRVTFGATASYPFSYLWSFTDGTLAPGSSRSDRTPSVDYTALGPHTYSVAVSYTFLLVDYVTMLLGPPVYVGSVAAQPADSYPTGHVVFASPAAGQAVALSSFPSTSLITLNAALPVRQCDGTAVDPSGHDDLTLFSDRGLIDPAADVDPATPGIQVTVSSAGTLSQLPLITPASQVEGSSTLYLEYYSPDHAVVTAAGDTTFTLTSDTRAPSVLWSSPASDCATSCLNPGDRLAFQLSEPLSAASLSNAKVDLFSGTSCTGAAAADLTSSSSVSYEAAANALFVVPPPRLGSYAVRVRLPASITDTAAANNALTPFSRCVVFGSLPDPGVPGAPQLIAAPAAFSPDGDQQADTASWSVSVDDATSLVRLRITRAQQTIWERLTSVTGAGTYTLVWDGADPSGRIVNNAAYGYALDALNRAGQASVALRGYVEVNSAVHMVSLRRRQ